MTAVHICAPAPDEVKLVRQVCPSCERPRRMVLELYEWYGPELTCLRCGDAWDEDGRRPRPFYCGWRRDRIHRAWKQLRRHRLQHTTSIRSGTMNTRHDEGLPAIPPEMFRPNTLEEDFRWLEARCEEALEGVRRLRAAASPEDGANVVLRLNVVRADREYMVALLRKRLSGWNPATGHIRLLSAEILNGECPVDPEHLPAMLEALEEGAYRWDPAARASSGDTVPGRAE